MHEEHTILTIDIGNSTTKICVFEGERLIQSVVGSAPGTLAVETMLDFYSVDGIAYCCVGKDSSDIGGFVKSCGVRWLVLGPDTPLPIEVRYDRCTLGADRVAAAVGACSVSENVLIVDAGTAVTTDLVAGGVYLGGNISPGLHLRFKALSDYTSRLPRVSAEGEIPLLGHDTVTAIRAGVVGGLVSEIKDIFLTIRNSYKDLKIVLTGGDSPFLVPLLRKSGVNAETDPETLGRGLVRIFNYNDRL